MTTGLHTVRDITCAKCGTLLGWKYGQLIILYSLDNPIDRSAICRQSVRRKSEIQGGKVHSGKVSDRYIRLNSSHTVPKLTRSIQWTSSSRRIPSRNCTIIPTVNYSFVESGCTFTFDPLTLLCRRLYTSHVPRRLNHRLNPSSCFVSSHFAFLLPLFFERRCFHLRLLSSLLFLLIYVPLPSSANSP